LSDTDREPVRILVVDDEPAVRDVLSRGLGALGYQVSTADSAEAALARIADSIFDVLITDLSMPGMGGMELIPRAKAQQPDMAVIVITAYATVESAVKAMKDGARDYLTKPFSMDEVLLRIERVISERALSRENIELRRELRRGYNLAHGTPIVGTSPEMKAVFDTIAAVGPNRSNVLIQGETGTGKEVVAKAIHHSGPRSSKPFIALNCGSVSKSLLESQLFGHVKGAFTGAVRNNPGFFVAAQGGTLFLDEVTEIDTEIQVRLLRAVQEREVTPVGGATPVPVDVRIVAATNRGARQAVEEGVLRQDLFYRLAVVVIDIPPLRTRRGDIPALVRHFNARLSTEYGLSEREISPEAMDLLMRYDWPGNVRELENAIERAFALGAGATITPDDLPPHLVSGETDAAVSARPGAGSLDETIAAVERAALVEALRRSGNNRARAAKELGIERKKLYRLLHKHGFMSGGKD